MLDTLKQINSTSAFNRWAGFEVTRAELFAQTGDQLKLVATGDTILVPVESR
ncbi:hypothetical protein [Pseudomonas laurylsulfatiphila]|uniref:hypothetical protein n=1 Tax=Pseudomonas laurylsulfatiphila TaxID=2011015 RepID=UPI003D1F959F|nr:hypothetical protein [Pseudomonas reinekei]MDF9906824.1 hypothetical protein [Pseudomonas reinekei]